MTSKKAISDSTCNTRRLFQLFLKLPPIYRVPRDVFYRILQFFCNSYAVLDHQQRTPELIELPQMVAVRVCHAWHDIVMKDPSLWRRLVFRYGMSARGTVDKFNAALAYWVKKAAPYTLSLTLSVEGRIKGHLWWDVTASLEKWAWQLGAITLVVPDTHYCRFLGNVDFLWLRHLELDLDPFSHNAVTARSSRTNPFPLIRSLDVVSLHPSQFPDERVTSRLFSLSLLYHAGARGYRPTLTSDWSYATALAGCSNLVELSLGLGAADPSSGVAVQGLVELMTLRTLRLRFLSTQSVFGKFLEDIRCPNLLELDVDSAERIHADDQTDLYEQRLTHLILQSPCTWSLRSFSIRNVDFKESELICMLIALRALWHFEFMPASYSESYPNLFRRFQGTSNWNPLCLTLDTLRVGSSEILDFHKRLMGAIQSRCLHHLPLKRVQLVYYDDLLLERAKLDECIEGFTRHSRAFHEECFRTRQVSVSVQVVPK
ncbi:hypothetical protein CONPUDRAFT_152679 [Coniophora puteana RWD-64-598 SS2]|uniref:F-box domain-containing protein n=1 Tax=Coniophora puteana (strain RWD-64-598) TaxID=741705 RepID=A0A5M3MSZ7_CONPW|nr:uncharacterized protein CONPUDRAFT_152679 [Coniophora puteana RWD-64-598 SS2]EIW81775.1 hypothetical protein CONPUDRAFT_152679 [Coniophora puteana RWD-64-598 SS2]